MFRRTLLILSFASIAALTTTEPSAAQPAGGLSITAAQAPPTVATVMSKFNSGVLSAAKAGGGTFPGYAAWLSAASSAIMNAQTPRVGGPRPQFPLPQQQPSLLSVKGSQADAELASFVPPGPTGHDTEAMASYFESMHCGPLANSLVRLFQDQPYLTRAAASQYLTATYSLPH